MEMIGKALGKSCSKKYNRKQDGDSPWKQDICSGMLVIGPANFNKTFMLKPPKFST